MSASTPATERYERQSRIATGGMGEVWRARDTVLDRPVAVKVLKQEYADDPSFRTRFENEARHAASLHHPGIASVFDYGVHEQSHTPYLVMELVEGKPLSELLASGRPFDPEQARALVAQAADALAVAHAVGVVHRDVKPANLIVTPEGQVKVTDFGIARAIDSVPLTATGQVLGTPHYLSPEQARGESAGPASDVYALGVVLYECLAGRRPFEREGSVATALAHLHDDPPALPPGVPPDLADTVARALAKDPAERYPDGAALAAALRGRETPRGAGHDPQATRVLPVPTAVPTGPAPTRVVAAPPREDRRRGRGPLVAALLAALAVVVALLVWHPWTSGSATATGGSAGSSSPSPSPSATRSATQASSTTVQVRRSDYVGRPVDDVRRDLQRLGLTPVVQHVPNPDGRHAETVADLSPTGEVKAGSRITVRAWDKPATVTPSRGPGKPGKPGKGHGHGGKGG